MAQRVHAIENKGDFKVIVAIDFGTHGTGIGYAVIDQDQKEPETYIEQDWCQNADNKNKTDILLSPNGDFIAFGEKALEQLSRCECALSVTVHSVSMRITFVTMMALPILSVHGQIHQSGGRIG